MKTLSKSLCILSLLILSQTIVAAPVNISPQQAVHIAQQASTGRVLGVKRKGELYRVKTLLPNGEVKITRINVHNGQIKPRR